MPPMSRWFGPRDEIEIFLAESPLSGDWRWRVVRTQANGQPALAFYAWDPEAENYQRFALNVLSFRGDLISDVTAFLNRTIDDPADEAMKRMPEQPADAMATEAAFDRFGLPDALPA